MSCYFQCCNFEASQAASSIASPLRPAPPPADSATPSSVRVEASTVEAHASQCQSDPVDHSASAPGAGQEKLPNLGTHKSGAEKPSATSSYGISPQADVNEQLPDIGASKTAEPSQENPRSSTNPPARSQTLSKGQTQPKASGSSRPSSGKSASSKQATLVCAS